MRLFSSSDVRWLTDAFSGQAMGLTAENVAEKYHVTREEQDQFSVHSQLKAAQAQAEGIFADEIAPLEVSGTLVEKDEGFALIRALRS